MHIALLIEEDGSIGSFLCQGSGMNDICRIEDAHFQIPILGLFGKPLKYSSGMQFTHFMPFVSDLLLSPMYLPGLPVFNWYISQNCS